MPDILVIGSLNADLVVRAQHFPLPGETISGEDLQIFPGGKGANQAVAAARLGASVSMLGRVGKDNFGNYLLENLESNKVDSQLVQSDDASTGTAIIVVDSNGQNSIVLSAGANGRVSPADVRTASFPDPSTPLRHSLWSQRDGSGQRFSLLLLQLEIPIETVLSATRRAKESGLRVLLNPAPARSLPEELISLPDFLLPNEIELSLLTDQTVNDIPSAEKAAKILLERGAQTIILTLGANGALIATKEMTTHIPPFKVNVVDTTAAGDAFIGGFAVRLLECGRRSLTPNALEMEEAVRYGCACGALATTRFGAQPSLPTREEVERFMSLRAA